MKNKKSWIKSRSTKILALYYWGKFLGINPLSLSKKNKLQYSCTSLFYSCLLIMMYCYMYYRLFVERLTLLFPEETPIAVIVDFVGFTCQFLELSSAWFVFGIYQNRVKIIIKSFVTAGKTSEKLGIPNDWNQLFEEFGTHIFFNNLLYLVSIIGSHWMWSFIHEKDAFLWIKFDVPVLTSFNTKITFIWCLVLVQRKFQQLNAAIKFLMQDSRAKRNRVDRRLIGRLSCESNRVLDKIHIVSQLHRELRDIIYHVEEHFAAFVLFSIGNGFTYLTLNTYRMYIYMKGGPGKAIELKYMGALSHWIIYPVVFLVVMSNVCGSTLDEANNTGCVVHKLLNKCKYSHDIRESVEFKTLSLNLLQNQVSMSLYGLFKLDYFLVYRIVATGTTYLTIMLQLYN